jgi:hypothetical protein
VFEAEQGVDDPQSVDEGLFAKVDQLDGASRVTR